MSDDAIIFKAKLTNLGRKSLFWLGVMCCSILIPSTVITAAVTKFFDCSAPAIAGTSLAMFFLVALPLALYACLRPRYLIFDGTTISGARPFFTVRRQVASGGHELGAWKFTTTNLDEPNKYRRYTGGPVITIACTSGRLSVGCLHPLSHWLGKVHTNSKSISPDFTIDKKDFSLLLEALNFTGQ